MLKGISEIFISNQYILCSFSREVGSEGAEFIYVNFESDIFTYSPEICGKLNLHRCNIKNKSKQMRTALNIKTIR